MTSEDRLAGSRGSARSRIWDTRVWNTVWKGKIRSSLYETQSIIHSSLIHLSFYWGTRWSEVCEVSSVDSISIYPCNYHYTGIYKIPVYLVQDTCTGIYQDTEIAGMPLGSPVLPLSLFQPQGIKLLSTINNSQTSINTLALSVLELHINKTIYT